VGKLRDNAGIFSQKGAMADCFMTDKSISTDFSLRLKKKFSAYQDVTTPGSKTQSKQFWRTRSEELSN
jgi:hypothetical protein